MPGNGVSVASPMFLDKQKVLTCQQRHFRAFSRLQPPPRTTLGQTFG